MKIMKKPQESGMRSTGEIRKPGQIQAFFFYGNLPIIVKN
jgi:hypothetical protein